MKADAESDDGSNSSMSSDDEDFNPDELEARSAKEEYDSDPSDTGTKVAFSGTLEIFSVSDPDHWPGSGSVSGNVDLDPGTKKNSDKLAYISTNIIKI